MIYLLLLILLGAERKNWASTFLIYAPIIDAFHNFLPGKQIGYEVPKFLAFAFTYFAFYQGHKLKIKAYCGNPMFIAFISLYFLVLIVSLTQSTDFFMSLQWLMNYSIAIISVIFYYYLFSISDNVLVLANKFFKICIITASLWLLYISLCSIFQYGRYVNDYGVESVIFFGHSNFYQLFPWVYLLSVFPYLIANKFNLRYVIIWVGSLFIFFLVAKRTYVYITILIAIMSLAPQYLRLKKIMMGLVYLSIIFLSLYLGRDIINKYFFKARKASMEHSYYEEGRFMEYAAYKDEILNKQPVFNILFGKELFNSGDKFFQHSKYKIFQYGPRALHSDFSTLLYGAGLIGISIYFIILISIGLYFFKISIGLDLNDSYKMIKYMFWALLVAIIVNGLSDGILGFSNRFIPFMLLGTNMGVINNLRNSKRNAKITTFNAQKDSDSRRNV
jgi:hypothetical protein